jgi:hypothetical protein
MLIFLTKIDLNYLEKVSCRDGMVASYVRLGQNAYKLLDPNSHEKLFLNFNVKKTVTAEKSNGSNEYEETDDILKKMEEDCFDELKETIMKEFPDIKNVYVAIPISIFREISEKLPCSNEELMQIDQVTIVNKLLILSKWVLELLILVSVLR